MWFIIVSPVVIRHLLWRQLLLWLYLQQQRVRVRVMIVFLVQGRVRIKIRIKVRVRVRIGVIFKVSIYHRSNMSLEQHVVHSPLQFTHFFHQCCSTWIPQVLEVLILILKKVHKCIFDPPPPPGGGGGLHSNYFLTGVCLTKPWNGGLKSWLQAQNIGSLELQKPWNGNLGGLRSGLKPQNTWTLELPKTYGNPQMGVQGAD